MVIGKYAANRSTEEGAKERLLVEAAQREPTKFAELYEENFERVYAFIARRVYSRNEAEDLTSEVFYKALANLPRFKWRGVPFAVWLFRIAANMIADRAKRAARELELPDDYPANGSHQASLEDVEHRARLFRLVEALPPDQRRVIVMRFAEEKSIHEIAQELERTEGAVKQLQFRALKNLRASMDSLDG